MESVSDPNAMISPLMEVKMKLETVEDQIDIVFEPSLDNLNVDKPYEGSFAQIIHLLIGKLVFSSRLPTIELTFFV